jgi:transposase
MSIDRDLTDEQWARIEPLLPSSKGKRSRPFLDHRPLVNGIIYRYRTGCPWRDLPERYGPWWSVWRRHTQLCRNGTWDRVLTRLLAEADAAGGIDWRVSVDSTTARVHQHAATLHREVVAMLPSHTGGSVELHKLPARAG